MAEQNLSAKLETLLELITLTASPEPFFQVTEQISAAIPTVTSVRQVCLHLLNPNRTGLELVHAINFSETSQRLLGQQQLELNQTPKYFQEAIDTGRIVRVQDIFIEKQMVDEQDSAGAEQLKALLCVPLFVRGDVVGTLTCYYAQEEHISSEDESILKGVGALLALVVENVRMLEERADLFRRVEELTLTCKQTGLYNRRYLASRLGIEVSRALRYNRPLSCFIFELENLRQINETFGTPIGNFILSEFGQLLLTACRDSDIPVRYSEAEFALLAVETPQEGAEILGRRLLKLITTRQFHELNRAIRVHCSVGIVSIPNPKIHSGEELLSAAATALAQAKQQGKNQLGIFA